jgi:hypothetical protein
MKLRYLTGTMLGVALAAWLIRPHPEPANGGREPLQSETQPEGSLETMSPNGSNLAAMVRAAEHAEI